MEKSDEEPKPALLEDALELPAASESETPAEAEATSQETAETEADGSSLEERHTTPHQTDTEDLTDDELLAVESPVPNKQEAASEETAEDTDAAGKEAEQSQDDVSGDAAALSDVQEQGEGSAAEADSEGETAASPPNDEDAPDNGVNYKNAYNKIMAPFKANGREFKVENPDEAVRLMQMGANYTKKMQSLAPNLKLMRMLDNNQLLTEDKIAYLIDLSQSKPAAVSKLLKDGNIDPMEIDTDDAAKYQAGDYSISDKEMSFHDILEDVTSTKAGKETVQHIDTVWDKASKATVFDDPTILSIINEQRSNGIYDKIATEVDRQKTLGTIPNTTPFIEAYKIAGDKLQAQGAFGSPEPDTGGSVENTEPGPKVLETRTGSRKPTVTNGEKAKAASSVKVYRQNTAKRVQSVRNVGRRNHGDINSPRALSPDDKDKHHADV